MWVCLMWYYMTLAVRWQEVVSKRDMMHSLNVQVIHELLHFALSTLYLGLLAQSNVWASLRPL